MRTTRDRIRHATLFEVIALIIVTPVGGAAFGISLHQFGLVSAVSSATAVLWNSLYNLLFDHGINWHTGSIKMSMRVRVLHTPLLEAGLVAILVPFIACYVGVPWWDAFLMDVSLSCFYLHFTLVLNLGYDAAFPAAGVRRVN